jgi:hypothetical protein
MTLIPTSCTSCLCSSKPWTADPCFLPQWPGTPRTSREGSNALDRRSEFFFQGFPGPESTATAVSQVRRQLGCEVGVWGPQGLAQECAAGFDSSESFLKVAPMVPLPSYQALWLLLPVHVPVEHPGALLYGADLFFAVCNSLFQLPPTGACSSLLH